MKLNFTQEDLAGMNYVGLVNAAKQATADNVEVNIQFVGRKKDDLLNDLNALFGETDTEVEEGETPAEEANQPEDVNPETETPAEPEAEQKSKKKGKKAKKSKEPKEPGQRGRRKTVHSFTKEQQQVIDGYNEAVAAGDVNYSDWIRKMWRKQMNVAAISQVTGRHYSFAYGVCQRAKAADEAPPVAKAEKKTTKAAKEEPATTEEPVGAEA